MAAYAQTGGEGCFHCGLPLPATHAPTAELEGAERAFCCFGCRAVAELIVGSGSGAYYRERTVPASRAEDPGRAASDADLLADDPDLLRVFSQPVGEDAREALLTLEGAHCAACVWLIERHLGDLEGVDDVQASVATARVRVVWRPEVLPLSSVLGALRSIGYAARPHCPDLEESRQRSDRRASLRRLGVAGLGTMQVMMFAIGLYAGEASGMASAHRALLRWGSWLVASVVVLFAGWPFFAGALRDLRRRAPGMDVPVALAIAVAYGASAWSTATGHGPVYFESACMFTFLLGLTRHIEMSARHARDARVRGRLDTLPEVALRLGEDGPERVPATALGAGDRVRVEAGDVVPADGRVIEGRGGTDESLLTGEAHACGKRVGDCVIGGSRWLSGEAVLLVERPGAESTAARIRALLERAQLDRPPAERLADRIAARFVAVVIVCAAAVFGTWWWLEPGSALPVTLSVLVATCPCALSLATPTALASASAGLAERGFLIARGHVLETLGRVDHVVFDKTGTLTTPEHRVTRAHVDGSWSEQHALALARALERWSDHPIARALAARAPDTPEAEIEADFARRLRDVRGVAGRGVEARLDRSRVRIGRPDWVAAGQVSGLRPPAPDDDESWIALAVDDVVIAWLAVGSVPRAGAAALVSWLRDRGLLVSLSSGDPSRRAVARLAARLGIDEWRAGEPPEGKLEQVAALQARGEVVAVVGDGLNDAPVMSRADLGIALAGGADLARVSADAVVFGERLDSIGEAWRHAARTRRIMRQNMTWAVLYNLSILPAAALGWVAPWMAALGMSASSLIVVGNSLRLRGVRASRRSGHEAAAGVEADEPNTRSAVWVGS